MSDTVTVRFEPWPDADVESYGFHVRSPYVEFCWTWHLGPTPVLLLRWAATMIELEQGPVTVDLAEVGRSLGVGTGVGVHSRIRHTLDRLERFDFAAAVPGGYALRQHAKPLANHKLTGAPEPVQQLHWRLLQERHPSRRAG